MSDKKSSGFTREIPKSLHVLEKPMNAWASGKIKKIYDSYESFCHEIGLLLGEPATQLKTASVNNAVMIDEFDFLWEQNQISNDNIQQLLTLLSGFYKAGFVVQSSDNTCKIKSYFVEDTNTVLGTLLEESLPRFTPFLSGSDSDLKPISLETTKLVRELGLKDLDFKSDTIAFHFWLYPDQATSLIVLSDTPEPARREILLKTAALIQRRFYD